MLNGLFLKDEALLSISPAGRGQLVKMLTTLEPHGIFGSNFAYLYILTFNCPATDMQNGDKASPSISPTGRDFLIKMLIILEPHGIF